MSEDREEEQEKRRGAALIAGLPGGAGRLNGAAIASRLIGTAVRRTPKSLLLRLSDFLSTYPGMALMSAVVLGASVFSLYGVSAPAKGPRSIGRLPLPPPYDGVGALPSDGTPGGDSLGYFSRANRGADEVQGAQSGQASDEDSEKSKNEDGKPAAPDGKDAAAAAGKDAAAAQGSPAGETGTPRAPLQSLGFSNPGRAGGFFSSLGSGRPESAPPAGRGEALKGSSRPVLRKTPVVRVGQRGSALGQLRRAALESNRGRAAGASETKSFHAAEAFNPAPIGGAGTAVGGAGTQPAAAGVTPGAGGEPVPSGSSTGQGNTNAGDEGEVCGEADGCEDVTPWADLVSISMILLGLAAAFLLISTVLGLVAKNSVAGSPTAVTFYSWAKWAAWAAAVVAGIVTLMGVWIMFRGQLLQGGIFTGTGALLTYLSYISAESFSKQAADAKLAAASAVAAPAAVAAAYLLRPKVEEPEEG